MKYLRPNLMKYYLNYLTSFSFSDLKSVFFCEFLHCFLKARNTQVTFAENWKIGNEQFKATTSFTDTAVKRALLSLPGGLLETTAQT